MGKKSMVQQLSEQEIVQAVTEVVQLYQLFDNDIVDLINASGLSIKEADKIVRKRYKEFMIN